MKILKNAARPIVRSQNAPFNFPKAKFFEPGVVALLVLFLPLLLISNARIAATDEAQYYVYLTSLRFDGDFDFANDYARLAEMNPKANIEALLRPDRIRPKTGLYGNIAPVGSAILWAPFFLTADAFVHAANAFGAGIPADGFSQPYVRAVCYGSAVYGLLGLLLCYRIARRYATSFASGVSTLAIWLATPLVFYMFVQMGFAHANGFFLVSLFFWLWLRGSQGSGGLKNSEFRIQNSEFTIHDSEIATPDSRLQTKNNGQRSIGGWIALGIVGGLMTITREQLGLFLLLPALEAIGQYWHLFSVRRSAFSVQPIARLFARHILFLVVFLITLLPQLATYQVLNGAPRPASEVGGKFNLCSPHAVDTLVDYNPAPSAWCNVGDDPAVDFPPFAHGAFVWSPILPLALLGLLLLWRRDRFLLAALIVAFVAQVYLNGAFGTTWHLTNSFGFRRLIECSPIFILGLAIGLDWAKQWFDWRALSVIACLFVVWNFGLIANWTVLQPELRKGLAWPQLWAWQLDVPLRLFGTLRDLLLNRCTLMENGC